MSLDATGVRQQGERGGRAEAKTIRSSKLCPLVGKAAQLWYN
jgi:hypothetical protein